MVQQVFFKMVEKEMEACAVSEGLEVDLFSFFYSFMFSKSKDVGGSQKENEEEIGYLTWYCVMVD